MIKKNKKIFICATEQSGDNIGYNIISRIIQFDKNIIFDGVGGSKMFPLLSNQYYSLKNFNSMGIIEILFSLNKYIKMISFLKKKILINNYDVVITIDSPDFNYPLIKKLRKNNFNNPIIQVVAPSVWAWRKNRAKKFSKVFNEILVLFEFEIDYFKKHGLNTTHMGHPIYYIKNSKPSQLHFDNNIAFLPGSRISELNKLLPYFKIAYEYLLQNNSKITIFIPTLPHLKTTIKNFTKSWKMKVIISSNNHDINEYYYYSTKALVCSGTASLEIAKRNIPQLVIYKLNFITELLAKKFINVNFANIINILENKMIIPEITNSKLNKKSFLVEFKKLMHNDKDNLKQIRDVQSSINKIEADKPPYSIAVERIISYLPNFSKAN